MFKRMLSRAVPVERDPADYGTCIGLEYSLDEAPAQPAPPPAPDGPPTGWVQRLTSRGKSAR